MMRFLPAILLSLVAGSLAVAQTVEFNRDVRPILSDHCFQCHGPDRAKRKGGFRLDLEEEARKAIVSGKPTESELHRRITAAEDSERMPPLRFARPLSRGQVDTLKRWIEQGAKWQKHWAFLPPRRAPVPAIDNRQSANNNPIDFFISAKRQAAGLAASSEAEKSTLIRRVTLDLTGLPPTLAEVDAFLADRSPDAYEKVVDRLLASPRYGEHMVLDWLDAARYADSNGYQQDRTRTNWPWRDGVIRAMNANMPFEQFTIEQLAGDLLPNATPEQKIATGFNRNHPLNGEGGRVAEESRIDYVIDRVNTTATTWLGLTVACAQCHDHKYDPIAQKEFYQLFAYFNNVPESGAVDRGGNAAPVLSLGTAEQNQLLASKQKEITELERDVKIVGPHRRSPVKRLTEAKKELAALNNSIVQVMVMEEKNPPRESHILIRGVWDKPGDKVSPGVPATLIAKPQAVKNRLELARWLVDPTNPLTARVTVNRHWQMFFGVGLVKTSEDFGTQGELPSHPELLDWLAVEFMQSGWDVKRLHRLIVTSATYRQSSKVTPQLRERDPDNRLLARGPRHRLSSLALRDQALAVSGLLVERQGGAPVKPYQPGGIWEEFSFNQIRYTQDKGTDLYRRSVYTFWRRSVAPTTLFDTASRQTCTVRQTRTNTPLQALTLWNDVTYVEAARLLAERAMNEGGKTAPERLRWMFRLVTARQPRAEEEQVLRNAHERLRKRYEASRDEAVKLLSAGEKARDVKLDVAELAAYSGIASLVLNLDEVLSKE